MANGNIVRVINRTEGPLSYMYDGREQVLQPGENHISSFEVDFARTQNIVMGSENPLNPAFFVSLVGVQGRDDCTPIVFTKDEKGRVHAMFEDGSSMPVGIERLDRREFGAELQNVTIERNRIPLRTFEVERTALHDASAGAIGG